MWTTISFDRQNDTEKAALVGKAIAEKALKQGIEKVSFDRGGYLYKRKGK
ncbi:MAG: 50S ribosomal protein L18 [Hoylesella saccharolytica]